MRVIVLDFLLLKIKWDKKFKLSLLFILIAVSLTIISYYLFFSAQKPKYSVKAGFEALTKTDVKEISLSNLSNDKCYWIRTSHNGTNYILAIREYSSESQDCSGDLLNKTEIPLPKAGNVMGDTTCICGKGYTVEKIEKEDVIHFKIEVK